MGRKILFLLKDIKNIYKKNIFYYFLASLIFSYSISKENSKIFSSTSNLFSALLVIEIAYIAIFYSGTEGTKKAKAQEYNKSKKISFYDYLLVKNYFSILLKFLVIFLLYIIEIYNIFNFSVSIFIFDISIYNTVIGIAFLSIIITVDLVVSMYYFLRGS